MGGSVRKPGYRHRCVRNYRLLLDLHATSLDVVRISAEVVRLVEEVVPGLVEVEVAVPRSRPAVW